MSLSTANRISPTLSTGRTVRTFRPNGSLPPAPSLPISPGLQNARDSVSSLQTDRGSILSHFGISDDKIRAGSDPANPDSPVSKMQSDNAKSRQTINRSPAKSLNGKRGRPSRTAVVQDTSVSALGGSQNMEGSDRSHKPARTKRKLVATSPKKKLLPPYQYETTLVRRAIRPGEAPPPQRDSAIAGESSGSTDTGLNVYGDVSLGMQFQLAEGKYIVKSLIPLKDGRASPAQLAGCIQRGDVLLQINNQSLVNIPPYQFMKILMHLLMTPHADGSYPRRITLRFAAGQGLEMLERSEEDDLRQRKSLTAAASSGTSGGAYPGSNAVSDNIDGAADVLGLFSFTMVDQLSGMPMFMDHDLSPPSPPAAVQQMEPQKLGTSEPKPTEPKYDQSVVPDHPQTRAVPLENAISFLISQERHAEREECDSEFFSWNDSLSPLLRRPSWSKQMPDTTVWTEGGSSGKRKDGMTKADMLELGNEAVKGARKLQAILQKIDLGWSDRRSFHSLSATLSLYSRASTRRRYVLDAKAMPVNFEQLQEVDEGNQPATSEDEGSSVGSNSNEEDDLNADDFVLRLAAQDEIWKKQVIEFLEDVVEKLNNPEGDTEGNDASPKDNDSGATSAVSTELGSFLFGDRIAKALMLHKKPQALPPDEITALLFDLITNVSATVPDQINAAGNNATVRSAVVPFITMKKPDANSDVMLAGRFLLDDVLPVWLKTFRPLPWDQRRVLWPLEKSLPAESTAESIRSDDSMTVDSMNTKQQTPTSKRKTKNLREQIEDQELNLQTREETRFMVTFYFTQKLLPQLMRNKDSTQSSNRVSIDESALQAAKTFVQDYGAYLRLHTCIAYAAVLKAQDIIKILLEVAKHDPQHREALRRFSRPSSLFFYEPSSLSAVVERLYDLKKETSPDQSLTTIQLCASAYPDVRPWQVDRECRGLWRRNDSNTGDQRKLNQLYFKYLTYLLHPSDGHEAARHDSALVTEWCELAVRGYLDQPKNNKNDAEVNERRKIFYFVASKASSDHLAYTRDLNKLIGLSMEAKEYSLALDLATEILDDPSRTKKKSLFNSIMVTLRTIGFAAIESFDSNGSSQRTLKRIFRLFQRANGMGTPADLWAVDIPAEVAGLLNHATQLLGPHDHKRMASLIHFFSKDASPKELLLALATWAPNAPKLNSDLFHVLRTILQRGANDSASVAELSICLQRVRRARRDLQNHGGQTSSSDESSAPDVPLEGSGLWKKMSRGMLSLAK